MSLSRRNPRRDANEKALVAGWQAIGAKVYRVSGKGLPDVLVLHRGILRGFEIKTAKGRLTEHQGEWPVIRTMDEALKAIGVKPCPPVSGDALTALVEQWRKKFPAMTAHKQSADDYWAGQCSGANKCADELTALIAAGRSAPTRWTGLMAGFAPAETDRSTTGTFDQGGPKP